jgi:hypothetical protein
MNKLSFLLLLLFGVSGNAQAQAPRRFAFQAKNYDVTAALNPADDSVWVVTKSGVTIKHTKYHVDRAGFTAQVKNYCTWL